MRIKRELPLFLLLLLLSAIGSTLALFHDFTFPSLQSTLGEKINYLLPFMKPTLSYIGLKSFLPCLGFTAFLAVAYRLLGNRIKFPRFILYLASFVGNSLIGMFTMTWTYAQMFGLPISYYNDPASLLMDAPSSPLLTLSGALSGIFLAVSITFLLWIAEQVVGACVKKQRKSTLPAD